MYESRSPQCVTIVGRLGLSDQRVAELLSRLQPLGTYSPPWLLVLHTPACLTSSAPSLDHDPNPCSHNYAPSSPESGSFSSNRPLPIASLLLPFHLGVCPIKLSHPVIIYPYDRVFQTNYTHTHIWGKTQPSDFSTNQMGVVCNACFRGQSLAPSAALYRKWDQKKKKKR